MYDSFQTRLYCLTWHGCAQRHEHHGGDGVLEANGAAEMRRQVADDGGEQADDDDGDDEAGPAVQVVGGRNAGEQHLPEDGEEVHDVVETGRQPLLPRVLLILVCLGEVGRESEGGGRRGEEGGGGERKGGERGEERRGGERRVE